MASPAESLLPLRTTVAPGDQAELAAWLRDSHAADEAVYPLGGGTSLNYGLPARRQGLGLSLAGLDRVVDYPSRDLTVTVEAGMTLAKLATVLAAEQQELAVDVPQPDKATVGGVVATAWNGPRRYGWGSVRDQVIGISAVDGRGTPFKGGGRVVKNVAGYDFCKLLTGSLGTLGVITQVTFKLRPRSRRSVLVATGVADLGQAERLLAQMVQSATCPVAVELVGGPAWRGDPTLGDLLAGRNQAVLVAGLEGTPEEVDWMVPRLADEWRSAGATEVRDVTEADTAGLWRRLTEFASADNAAPLVVKASVVPSCVTRFVAELVQADADMSWQSHAGHGVVIGRWSQLPADGLSRALVGRLHPAAVAAHGSLVLLSNPSATEATRHCWWGGADRAYDVMAALKRQFDPRNLLNPGRYVFP